MVGAASTVPPRLELRDKFLRREPGGNKWQFWTLHLTQVAREFPSGGKEFGSQAVEAACHPDNRPAQTNRPSVGFKCTEQSWRASLPGRRSLGQGHRGPHKQCD